MSPSVHLLLWLRVRNVSLVAKPTSIGGDGCCGVACPDLHSREIINRNQNIFSESYVILSQAILVNCAAFRQQTTVLYAQTIHSKSQFRKAKTRKVTESRILTAILSFFSAAEAELNHQAQSFQHNNR